MWSGGWWMGVGVGVNFFTWKKNHFIERHLVIALEALFHLLKC
jgi:hypothetical protein